MEFRESKESKPLNKYQRYREKLKQKGKYEEYLSKSRERAKKSNKTRYHNHHNGYKKSGSCDSCGVKKEDTSTGYLIIHHKYFRTCKECMPIYPSSYHGNGKSLVGICSRVGHRETLCIPCHTRKHRIPNWEVNREFEKQDKHLQDIRQIARGG